jgi:anti-anti-sigma factor
MTATRKTERYKTHEHKTKEAMAVTSVENRVRVVTVPDGAVQNAPGKAPAGISILVSEFPSRKEIALLAVKGFIDTTTAPEFEKYFLSALDAKKFKLVIDLKETEYISSAGWGIFVSQLKRIREEKGDLVLAGMNPDVLEIFELLEFDTFLKSYSDVEEAVAGSFAEFQHGSHKLNPALSQRKPQ